MQRRIPRRAGPGKPCQRQRPAGRSFRDGRSRSRTSGTRERLSLKFLIDECPALSFVETAVQAGYAASAHVSRRSMAGFTDSQLMRRVLEGVDQTVLDSHEITILRWVAIQAHLVVRTLVYSLKLTLINGDIGGEGEVELQRSMFCRVK